MDTPGFAEGVALAWNLAFVADFDQGLEIIDITDPATATIVSGFHLPGRANAIAAGKVRLHCLV